MTTTTKLTIDMVTFGKGVCIGDGEICYDLYFNKVHVGEQVVSNGTRYEEEMGEVHKTSLFYENIEDVPSPKCYHCPSCGEVLYAVDEQYEAEWPNSSDIYHEQVAEEHEEWCSSNQYSFEDWRKDLNVYGEKIGISFPQQVTPRQVIELVIEAGIQPFGIPCPPDRMGCTNFSSKWYNPSTNDLSWIQELELYDYPGKFLYIKTNIIN